MNLEKFRVGLRHTNWFFFRLHKQVCDQKFEITCLSTSSPSIFLITTTKDINHNHNHSHNHIHIHIHIHINKFDINTLSSSSSSFFLSKIKIFENFNMEPLSPIAQSHSDWFKACLARAVDPGDPITTYDKFVVKYRDTKEKIRLHYAGLNRSLDQGNLQYMVAACTWWHYCK